MDITKAVDGMEQKLIYHLDSFEKVDSYALSVSCPMEFEDFPFDSQTCSLVFVSVSGTSSEVLLNTPNVSYNPKEHGYNGNPKRLKYNVRMQSLPSKEYMEKVFIVYLQLEFK